MTQEQSELVAPTEVAVEAAVAPVQPDVGSRLTVQLSKKLFERLAHTSKDEGISVEALVQELLAEAVTLRAWEIIERKSAMRGDGPSGNSRGYGQGQGGGSPQRGQGQGGGYGQGQHGKNGPRGHGQGGGGGGGRPRPGQVSNAWMEDKAAFLEYVRNQEKRGR